MFVHFTPQLNVHTVWLKQEFGRHCYFPDHTGKFLFDNEVGQAVFALTVEGAPSQTSEKVPCTTPASNSAHSSQPFYKSIANKKCTFNVKVVKANMNLDAKWES